MIEAAWGGTLLLVMAWAVYADLRTREIPDAIPIAIAVLALLRLASGGPDFAVSLAAGAALGIAIGTIGFAIGAFGGGDAKIAAALGACLGASDFLVTLAAAGIAGGVFVAARRGDAEIPYAPPLAFGSAIALGLHALDPATKQAWLAPGREMVVLMLAAGVVVTVIALRRVALGRRAARRLAAPDAAPVEVRARATLVGAASRTAPLLVGATVLALAWLAGATPLVASGIAIVPAVLAHLADARRIERRALKLEEQLGQAIHLAAAALRAGASPNDALERAARESSRPLRPLLEAVSQRLRLGEDPDRALAAFAERVPLDSYRLFATALAVQWRAGGSFDRALRSVARAVGDRVETARRVDTQTASVRASVVAIVLANIAIAGLAALANPASLGEFLRSEVGAGLLAATLWLQALALWWIARLAAGVR